MVFTTLRNLKTLEMFINLIIYGQLSTYYTVNNGNIVSMSTIEFTDNMYYNRCYAANNLMQYSVK